MGLIVLRLIGEGMWIHVECLQMISINDATNWFVDVGSTIALRCSFSKILLELGVGEIP